MRLKHLSRYWQIKRTKSACAFGAKRRYRIRSHRKREFNNYQNYSLKNKHFIAISKPLVTELKYFLFLFYI